MCKLRAKKMTLKSLIIQSIQSRPIKKSKKYCLNIYNETIKNPAPECRVYIVLAVKEHYFTTRNDGRPPRGGMGGSSSEPSSATSGRSPSMTDIVGADMGSLLSSSLCPSNAPSDS